MARHVHSFVQIHGAGGGAMKQQVVERARGIVEAVLGKPYAGAALDVVRCST